MCLFIVVVFVCTYVSSHRSIIRFNSNDLFKTNRLTHYILHYYTHCALAKPDFETFLYKLGRQQQSNATKNNKQNETKRLSLLCLIIPLIILNSTERKILKYKKLLTSRMHISIIIIIIIYNLHKRQIKNIANRISRV